MQNAQVENQKVGTSVIKGFLHFKLIFEWAAIWYVTLPTLL